MGLLKLSQIRDYWSTNEVLATPWFPAVMSRDHFFRILRFIHLADSSKQKKEDEEGYDALYKVRPLIDHLTAVFPKYYQPARELSLDEMMIGTRCRIAFLQYLPKKPTRFGIKVFVISEAKTGYVLNFQVYTGAVPGVSSSSSKKHGVAYRVVMELVDNYEGKGHCLFIDNYYTSPQLLIDLLEKNIYCAGTIRPNRKNFPRDIVPSGGGDIGTFRFATTNKLTAVWWRDRRDVYAISNMHNTSSTLVMKRPKGCKDKQPTPCPTIIADYNSFMGGVDLTDQHLSYYSLSNRRTIKWWKKVFWRLVDLCIVNAWIIYRCNYPNDSDINSQKAFRVKLAEELVQPLLNLRASTDCPDYLNVHRGKSATSETHLKGKHFPSKSQQRGRCCVCSRQQSSTGRRKDTKTQNYCKKCNAFLCFGSCFEVYRTRTSY